ncbi:MAG TPA: HlyD family type I secretion periplasmic adaptor subunit [Acetobacteraceae bacterium]|nr:HlyD family type I secretion periplasmic adaptor subunit [Acetobacteraceae bacterium]
MAGTQLQKAGGAAGSPGRSLVKAGRKNDGAPTALLEFQSPCAVLVEARPKPAARYTVWIVASMFAACAAVAASIPIDKVVTSTGKVVSLAANVVVQPLETSIVRSIDVQEGQFVRAGQVLARLDPTFAAADADAAKQQVAALQAVVDRLRAEEAGKEYRPAELTPETQVQVAIFAQRAAQRLAQLRYYDEQINGFRAQVARDEADAALYRQRVNVAQSVESMRLELQREQVGSRLNSLAAIDARLEATRSLANALNSAENDRRQLAATQSQRDAYDQQWRADTSQQITDNSQKLSDLKGQLEHAALRRQLVELRATQDAVVLSVAKVSVGSVLQSGDQFFTLVPLNAPLEIETSIQGSEAGYVHPGDPVAIKFDTFPYIQYGGAVGTVRLISPDSFGSDTPVDAAGRPNLPGQSAQTPVTTQVFYNAKITIDRLTLHDLPRGSHIVPGMPVAADIKVGKRTPLQWLFSRIAPIAKEGMREP